MPSCSCRSGGTALRRLPGPDPRLRHAVVDRAGARGRPRHRPRPRSCGRQRPPLAPSAARRPPAPSRQLSRRGRQHARARAAQPALLDQREPRAGSRSTTSTREPAVGGGRFRGAPHARRDRRPPHHGAGGRPATRVRPDRRRPAPGPAGGGHQECHAGRAGAVRRTAPHVPRSRRGPRADPEELFRLFSNLVSNAVKYSDPGGRVDLRVVLRTTGWWRLRGRRHRHLGARPGPALPRVLPVHQPRGPSRPGTGLGLAIVARIVERHSAPSSSTPSAVAARPPPSPCHWTGSAAEDEVSAEREDCARS